MLPHTHHTFVSKLKFHARYHIKYTTLPSEYHVTPSDDSSTTNKQLWTVLLKWSKYHVKHIFNKTERRIIQLFECQAVFQTVTYSVIRARVWMFSVPLVRLSSGRIPCHCVVRSWKTDWCFFVFSFEVNYRNLN